jgi:hypothetical protein
MRAAGSPIAMTMQRTIFLFIYIDFTATKIRKKGRKTKKHLFFCEIQEKAVPLHPLSA